VFLGKKNITTSAFKHDFQSSCSFTTAENRLENANKVGMH